MGDSRGQRTPVIRWMAALAASALLVGGGLAIGANLATGASSAVKLRLADRSTVSSGAEVSSSRQDLAGLRSCLQAARHLARTGNRTAARTKLHACLREHRARWLLRLRRLIRLGGAHGETTFATRKGSRTVAFERGVIQTVSSGSIRLEAADGTTLTWNLIGKTVIIRVRRHARAHTRTRASASALAAGQRVFVIGVVVGGADFARLIIIRG